jgi:DNA-binding NarL/FixJ family response regulator
MMFKKSVAGYKVQIVDDHQMLRVGVKVSMELSTVAIQWIESTYLQEALNTYRRYDDIDLVLLDLNLPDSKGLQSLQTFLHEFPRARLAIFSATEDPFVVRQALAMGALGLIPKSGDAETTVHLIEALLHREPAHRSGGVTETALHTASAASVSPLASTLSARLATGPSAKETLNATQLRVLELMLAGMSNHQISGECALALGTVKNTVSSIFLAFDVKSRAHLISLFR